MSLQKNSIKRIFDLFLSMTGLLILAPVFILLGCAIIIDDSGPVFFRQRRVGRNGRIFLLCKFRTMRVINGSEPGVFEPGNTSRVTSVGKFLRKYKLDELPQLINVIKGEMALVGPRPEVGEWVKVYPEKWQKVLLVRPGITDRASVEFRDEERLLAESSDPEATYREVILPRKLDLYIEYVNKQSFSEDLFILLLTVKSILFRCPRN